MSPIAASTPVALNGAVLHLGSAAAPTVSTGQPSFMDVLSSGMRQVEQKLSAADDLAQRFALDDTIPVHQVTYALEEARLAVELAMQVRGRLVETYRDLMNMQL